MGKFPCLRLAGESLKAGGLAPAVFNAANEVAVQAFIDERISFLGIPELIDACLQNADFRTPSSIDELLDLQEELLLLARDQLVTLIK
jgi:1-deoxy-D-xylulose-5-phosphate reductoisomerase